MKHWCKKKPFSGGMLTLGGFLAGNWMIDHKTRQISWAFYTTKSNHRGPWIFGRARPDEGSFSHLWPLTWRALFQPHSPVASLSHTQPKPRTFWFHQKPSLLLRVLFSPKIQRRRKSFHHLRADLVTTGIIGPLARVLVSDPRRVSKDPLGVVFLQGGFPPIAPDQCCSKNDKLAAFLTQASWKRPSKFYLLGAL